MLYFLVEVEDADYEDIIETTKEVEEPLINKTQIITEKVTENEQVESVE